jgi:hypothetical protein
VYTGMSWLVILTGHGRIQDQNFSLQLGNCLSPLHNGSQQQVSKYTSQHTGCHFTKERHIGSRYLEFLSPGHSPKINQSTSTTNFFFQPKMQRLRISERHNKHLYKIVNKQYSVFWRHNDGDDWRDDKLLPNGHKMSHH